LGQLETEQKGSSQQGIVIKIRHFGNTQAVVFMA